MGLLSNKDKVLTEALKKYAGSEISESKKIKDLIKDAESLKVYAYSLTDDEIKQLKNSIGIDEYMRLSKIIDEVKSSEQRHR